MASASETPISPVGVSKPELTISSPAMNEEPVELDGTPTSPENVRSGLVRRGSKAEVLAELSVEEREVCGQADIHLMGADYHCRNGRSSSLTARRTRPSWWISPRRLTRRSLASRKMLKLLYLNSLMATRRRSFAMAIEITLRSASVCSGIA